MELEKGRENLRKNVFARMPVQHCKKLFGVAEESPNLAAFQTQVGKAITDLI